MLCGTFYRTRGRKWIKAYVNSTINSLGTLWAQPVGWCSYGPCMFSVPKLEGDQVLLADPRVVMYHSNFAITFLDHG